MKKYGGRCAVCGVTELAVLTIDHVNDDGAQERRDGGSSGANFYKVLLSSERRDDLQVLCMNCNTRKRTYGPDLTTWPLFSCICCGNVVHLDEPGRFECAPHLQKGRLT